MRLEIGRVSEIVDESVEEVLGEKNKLEDTPLMDIAESMKKIGVHLLAQTIHSKLAEILQEEIKKL